MAKEKKGMKGQAPKVKPETHRNKTKPRHKSNDQWTALTRVWARMDKGTRELSKAILLFGLKKGQKIPTATKIFTSGLDKPEVDA